MDSSKVDVFVSYSRSDRERVKPVVKELLHRGWHVWWDADIRLGHKYRDEINEALDSASCVLVFWSHESVKSTEVIVEASAGMRRDVLRPVSLDEAEIPSMFTHLQAADYRQPGGAVDGRLHKIVASVQGLVVPETIRNPAIPSDISEALGQYSKRTIITEHDCGSLLGRRYGLSRTDHWIASVVGRIAADDVHFKDDIEADLMAGDIITPEFLTKAQDHGVESLYIRSVLSCRSKIGLCATCFGCMRGEKKLPKVGDKVGETFVGAFVRTGVTDRIADLLCCREAHRAVLTEVDGTVEITSTGVRVLSDFDDSSRFCEVPENKNLVVSSGQSVVAGQRLSVGQIVPRDVMRIEGVAQAQEHIIEGIRNEISYHGGDLDDRGIEILVRLMFHKCMIIDSGDTMLRRGEYVRRDDIDQINGRIMKFNTNNKPHFLLPATYEPAIMSIMEVIVNLDEELV